MHVLHLKDHFARIGARAKLSPRATHPAASDPWPVLVTIGLDDHGEFFDVQVDPARDVVLDVPESRHATSSLLLCAIAPDGSIAQRVLCASERGNWTVQAVPDDVEATSVHAVRDAIQPDTVALIRSLSGEGADAADPSNRIVHLSGRTGDIPRRS